MLNWQFSVGPREFFGFGREGNFVQLQHSTTVRGIAHPQKIDAQPITDIHCSMDIDFPVHLLNPIQPGGKIEMFPQYASPQRSRYHDQVILLGTAARPDLAIGGFANRRHVQYQRSVPTIRIATRQRHAVFFRSFADAFINFCRQQIGLLCLL